MIFEISGILIKCFHPCVRQGPLIVPEEDILQTCLQRSHFLCLFFFADEPGALLARYAESRADIRVFHYRGINVERKEIPNLKKPPKTISGPLL